MPITSYVIALGSNRRGRHGAPIAEVRAAIGAIGAVVTSPIVSSAPVGPSIRRFANAVAIVKTEDTPPALLARLKRVEHDFGRRRGRRWGARVIDLDIILWSGGAWRDTTLTIPHVAFRDRDFVLGPLMALVPDWRDPMTGRTMRHCRARLTRTQALPRSPRRGAGS